MTKIKITQGVKEMEGVVIEKPVTPFGTSAHISFPKQHTGKIVNVIVPTDSEYTWVLSEKELEKIRDICYKRLKVEKETRFTFHEIKSIDNLKEKKFSYDDLLKVCGVLERCKSDFPLYLKLKKVYNL